jgi:ferric-dicitrate binding protein FerR (iron transport regulator)
LKEHHTYSQLFSKYLSGNCSDEEKVSLEKWLKQSPENQVEFDDYQKIWQYAEVNEGKYVIDVDAGWKELNQRMNAVEALTVMQENKPAFNKRLIYIASRVAAVLIISLSLYFIFNSTHKNKETSYVQLTAAEVNEPFIVLSDGSEITLNNNASISYPEEFSADVRKIKFEGEAYFNIAHNHEKPFIIDAGDLQIKVLGTSFNFCTCPEGDIMVLYLESGKLQFASVNKADGSVKEQLILMPGQKGVYNKESGLISKTEYKNQNFLAWKTGVLTFEETPLAEVLSTIGQTYKLNIKTNKTYDACCLTARFENETPESIFESIHTIFGVEYDIDGQNVVLK